MTSTSVARAALLGSALTLSLAGLARAETEIRIDRSKIDTLSVECVALADAVEANDSRVADDIVDPLLNALNEDAAQDCLRLTERLEGGVMGTTERQAGARDSVTDEADATVRDQETTELSEEVNVQEEATIEGVARVDVPAPEVDVQVSPPEVTVRKQQPSVSIRQEPAEIELVQEQPRVNVQIPEIVVQVEIPAPSVFIRTSNPEVEIAAGDPQVEVQQGEPQVTVRQAEPELAIDLGVEEGVNADRDDGEAAVADTSATGQTQQVEGDVDVAGNQPRVEFIQPEGQPEFSYESGEPVVSYQGAEPQVTVEFTQQPTIQISRVGEPSVTYETAEERDRRRAAATDGAAMPKDRAAANDETRTAANDAAMQGDMLTVGDMLAMEVIGADGADLGTPEAFVENGDGLAMIISEGGFLGIGDDNVAIPMERVTVRNNQLHLQTLTEAEIEDAANTDYDGSQALDRDTRIRLN